MQMEWRNKWCELLVIICVKFPRWLAAYKFAKAILKQFISNKVRLPSPRSHYAYISTSKWLGAN